MRTLTGMVVVITGASAGIGRALAVELAGRGARLVLAARRTERLEELLKSLPGEHLAVPADVSLASDCVRIITATHERFARLDTLVCNAGVGLLRDIASTTRAEWEALFAVNLHGTLDCIRAALPLLRGQEPRDRWRGQVMIVSSILGRRAAPWSGAYSATKAAQLSVAEALRVELSAERIAVTSVHPIGTRSEFGRAARERSGVSGEQRPSRFDQTAEQVARRMVTAIARPCPEVWPSRPSRWLASLATFMPGFADRLAARLAKGLPH